MDDNFLPEAIRHPRRPWTIEDICTFTTWCKNTVRTRYESGLFPPPYRLPGPDGKLGRRRLWCPNKVIQWRAEEENKTTPRLTSHDATPIDILRNLGRPLSESPSKPQFPRNDGNSNGASGESGITA